MEIITYQVQIRMVYIDGLKYKIIENLKKVF